MALTDNIKSKIGKSKTSESFISHVLVTVINKILLVVLGVGTGIITARLLGPSGKGVLSLYISVLAIILSFGSLGIRQSSAYYLGKKIYSDQEVVSNLISLFIIVSIVGVFVALFTYSSLLTMNGEMWFATVLFALTVPLQLLLSYLTGILISKRNIKSINFLQLITQISNFVFVLLFVWVLDMSLFGACVAFILSQVIPLYIIIKRHFLIANLQPKFNRKIIANLIKTGIGFASALFVLQMNFRVDVLLLSKLSTQTNVGIYSVGVSLCEMVQQFPLALGLVLFSRSTTWANKDLKESLKKVTLLSRLLFVFIISMSAFVVILSPIIVPLLYGESYSQSANVAINLMFGIVFLSLFHNLHIFSAGQGKALLSIYAFTPGLFLNVLLNWYLIPIAGPNGAAISSTISYTFSALIYFTIFCHIYKSSFLDLLIPRRNDFILLFSSIKEYFFRGASIG